MQDPSWDREHGGSESLAQKEQGLASGTAGSRPGTLLHEPLQRSKKQCKVSRPEQQAPVPARGVARARD
jgi:hypothetical protein